MEFVRHRTFSFTQESTRYCNYSKDKFGNELTFIIPCWSNDLEEGSYNYSDENGTWITNNYITIETDNKIFLNHLGNCEYTYFMLLKGYWKPQQARAILPNSLKTELIMTGFISDWKHFFHLRTALGAHPQAQEIAIPLQEEFKHLGLL